MNIRPDIYLFNPTCDYAVANGRTSWQPNRLLRQMEVDLATLPMFYCNANDYILVSRLPSAAFYESFSDLEITLPNFILQEQVFNDQAFHNKKFGEIIPWGWSPATHKKFEAIKPLCSEEFLQSPAAVWYPEHRELHSRKTALQVLNQLWGVLPEKIAIPEDAFPVICNNRQEVEKCIDHWGKIIIKAPWSSSGRGLQFITKQPVHPKVWEKINGHFRDQGYVMAEPYLEKVFDLAFLFKVEKGKISFSGMSYFLTDKKGQYQGNLLNGIPDEIPTEILAFIHSIVGEVPSPLIQILEDSPIIHLHQGFFGVDALIYRDKDHQLKVNPCLEINFRYTMGVLSLYLEKLIHDQKKGVFRIFFDPGKSFMSFKNEMEKKFPQEIINNKLYSGFLPLTEARDDSNFGAWMIV